MAERNEKVLERVREELKKDTNLGSRDLYEIAKGMDSSIGNQKLQQFHARYVLPIKREQAGGAKGGRKKGKGRAAPRGRQAARTAAPAAKETKARGRGGAKGAAPASDRERVRAAFLEFAREFADAESRAQIVQVMSRVDDYVEKAVGRGG